jgi:hypothetical protein
MGEKDVVRPHIAVDNRLYIPHEGISTHELLQLQFFVVQTILADFDFFLQNPNTILREVAPRAHEKKKKKIEL